MDSEQLQLESIWCLTNIASDTNSANSVKVLIEAQILTVLKTLVYTPQLSGEVKMQAIWCYGNIAGESLELRDTILEDQVTGPIALALD